MLSSFITFLCVQVGCVLCSTENSYRILYFSPLHFANTFHSLRIAMYICCTLYTDISSWQFGVYFKSTSQRNILNAQRRKRKTLQESTTLECLSKDISSGLILAKSIQEFHFLFPLVLVTIKYSRN